jgi:hypothetical protein
MLHIANEQQEQLVRSLNFFLLAASYRINHFHAIIDSSNSSDSQTNSIGFTLLEREMDSMWSAFTHFLGDINAYGRLPISTSVEKSPLTEQLTDELKNFSKELVTKVKYSDVSVKLKSIGEESINKFKRDKQNELLEKADIEKRFDEAAKIVFKVSDNQIQIIESSLSFFLKFNFSFESELNDVLNEFRKAKIYEKKCDEYLLIIKTLISNDHLYNSNRSLMIKARVFYRNLLLQIKANELALSIELLDTKAVELVDNCFTIASSVKETR